MKTFLWLLLAALALSGPSVSAFQSVNCAKRSVCTKKDGKVCGSDGQTYATKCEFEAAYCDQPSDLLYIESDGACKKATKKSTTSADDEDEEGKTETVTPAPTTTTTTAASVPGPAAVDDVKTEAVAPASITISTPAEADVEVDTPVTPAPTTFQDSPAATDEAADEEPTEPETVTSVEQVDELSPPNAAAVDGERAQDKPAEQSAEGDEVQAEDQAQSSTAASASSASSASTSGSGSGGGGVDSSYAACQIKCPTDWIPVCGNDGETYPNECYRVLAKCRDPSLTTEHTGECVKASPPTDASTSASSTSTATTTTSLEVTASGSIKAKCNHICPKVYEPVCGSDSVTYANQCLLDYAACRTGRVLKIADGKCAQRKRGKTCVPEICTGVADALCGSDGTTYLNTCMFGNALCQSPLLTILHDGECDEDTQLKCTTLTCPKFTECREDDAIDVAYCADVCAAERCGENEECQLLDAECFTAPCSPVATCVPLETSSETEVF